MPCIKMATRKTVAASTGSMPSTCCQQVMRIGTAIRAVVSVGVDGRSGSGVGGLGQEVGREARWKPLPSRRRLAPFAPESE